MLIAVAAPACAATHDAPPPPAAVIHRPLVEMLSWWHAPGEADALQALIETHSLRYPENRVFNAVVGSSLGSRKIASVRLTNGDPPDLLQLNSREIPVFQRRYPGALQSLDDLVDALGLRATMFPEALDAMTDGDRVMAIPVNVHRENALFYNKHVFEAHGVSPPTTNAELLALCKTLKRAGVTPMATSFNPGWPLRILFNAILAGEMGSVGFRAFFSPVEAAEQIAKFRAAVAVFTEIVDNYLNVDAHEEGFIWTSAAESLYNGDAAMLVHGDWAKGYLTQLGWRPGVDFGVAGAPGSADLFLYVMDGFAIPHGAPNEAGAREFLVTVASQAGQVAFNIFKGSSPARGDVSKDPLDVLGRQTLEDLVRARVRMPAPMRTELDDAVVQFTRDRDINALLRTYMQYRASS